MSYIEVCHKGCVYDHNVCIHSYLTCLFGPKPTKEPSYCFSGQLLGIPCVCGPLLLSEVALFDVVQSIVPSATENKSSTGRPV